ncbi:MAG: ATP synthase protein I [Parvibaculaceae bacterium]|nr:AtpZ/AtpI family protein [Parvibaculaceae bacterium]
MADNSDETSQSTRLTQGEVGALSDLEKRIHTAQRERHKTDLAESQKRNTDMGVGLRLSTEFIAGIIAGTGLGWLLDYWLGTTPLFLILGLGLGFAAAIMNVLRVTKNMGTSSVQTDDTKTDDTAGNTPGATE